MNDVKMMLGKRAGEYYLFLTWCITSPILLTVSVEENEKRKKIVFDLHKVIIFSNILTSKPLSDDSGGGFDAYVFPQWSTILGWFMFAICVIPIPLVYIVTYIREYRSINDEKVGFNSD